MLIFQKNFNETLLNLVFSWAIIGWVATFLGMIGFIYPIVSLLLCVPLFFLFQLLRRFILDDLQPLLYTKVGVLLIFLLVLTLISHLVGVLLPETGFDALWYHLPLIRLYTEQHSLFYTTAFYQSLYPQLGDMIFLLGFQVGNVMGVKGIAYAQMLTVLLVVYAWLRAYIKPVWAVAGMLTVALFQVVSWQASSAYVDLLSALWFVAGCWMLLETDVRRDALRCVSTSLFFFACFLATKYVNLGFIPLIGLLLLVETQDFASLRNAFLSLQKHILKIFLFGFLTIFWYVRAWWYTGNVLYPMGSEYGNSLITQMGHSGWGSWLLYQLQHIYLLPYFFFFKNDGYVTLLLWMLPLIPLLSRREVGMFPASPAGRSPKRREFFVVNMIGVYGLLFWWFFPPPSTRYVLGPIIVLWIGIFIAYIHWMEQQKKQWITQLTYVLLFFSICLPLGIRLYVNQRGVPYLLGKETQQEYLQRFKNGFLDEKIEGFYKE